MRTSSFIGSDKSGGKTTVFNFIYKQFINKSHDQNQQINPVIITSIGINGEDIDQFDGKSKPEISIFKNSFFITSGEHLINFPGMYETIHCFSSGNFRKEYILGKSLYYFQIVLEGPNTGFEILEMKKILKEINKNFVFLIDGSIDRQFLANPSISDNFYFSMLLSDRKPQIKKAESLLFSLNIGEYTGKFKKNIRKLKRDKIKSILLDNSGEFLYQGYKPPFLDDSLKETILNNSKNKISLYLNGALSSTIHKYLAPFNNLTIILDNFTLYQNINQTQSEELVFKPLLFLLNRVNVKKVFVKNDINMDLNLLPKNLSCTDLFKGNYETFI